MKQVLYTIALISVITAFILLSSGYTVISVWVFSIGYVVWITDLIYNDLRKK